MTARHQPAAIMERTWAHRGQQTGAITLLVAMGLVVLASLTSFYSARSVLMDRLANQNQAHATQARLAADAALARAQHTVMRTPAAEQTLLLGGAPCPQDHTGPQWQCSALDVAAHPALQQAQLSALAVRDLVASPHVLTLHASARVAGHHSQAQVRESVLIPSLAPAPDLSPPAAVVLNGCISEAAGARLRVCPLTGQGTACASNAVGAAVHTFAIHDNNGDGHISGAEKSACLALSPSSLPGAGQQTGPSTAVAGGPCNRAAWRSVLGDTTQAQLQAWSDAQARNGLTPQTNPARTIYWVDNPNDWSLSVGTRDRPVLLVFSAKACAQRCPRIHASTRIVGSVLFESGCSDEKMRGWHAGTIEGQLVVESGLPEWQQGHVLAMPERRQAYALHWPKGTDATQVQRVNGSWSANAP